MTAVAPFLQANFYQDASSMGEMSPFLLFDGDDDAKMDKRGPHSGKTDVAKKVRCCGAMLQARSDCETPARTSCTP